MLKQPLYRFIAWVIIWMPIMFALWYILAIFHLAPVTVLAEQVIQWLAPDALLWLKLEGHELLIASNFATDTAGQIITPPPDNDALGFQQNPLIYSYGLPLLLALLLATPRKDKWWSIGVGVLCILPLHVFSMVFSVLKILTFEVGQAFVLQQGWSAWTVDMIALAYQMGTLLIPMIAPLIIWIALNREFVEQLAPTWATMNAKSLKESERSA